MLKELEVGGYDGEYDGGYDGVWGMLESRKTGNIGNSDYGDRLICPLFLALFLE